MTDTPTCPYCGNWQKLHIPDLKGDDGEDIDIYDCCDCSILFYTCPLADNFI